MRQIFYPLRQGAPCNYVCIAQHCGVRTPPVVLNVVTNTYPVSHYTCYCLEYSTCDKIAVVDDARVIAIMTIVNETVQADIGYRRRRADGQQEMSTHSKDIVDTTVETQF